MEHAGEIGLSLASVLGLCCVVLWFYVRGSLSKIDTHGDRIAGVEKDLAVARAERVGERVSKLEADMGEIKGDLREARTDIRRIVQWVDGQHHRPANTQE